MATEFFPLGGGVGTGTAVVLDVAGWKHQFNVKSAHTRKYLVVYAFGRAKQQGPFSSCLKRPTIENNITLA